MKGVEGTALDEGFDDGLVDDAEVDAFAEVEEGFIRFDGGRWPRITMRGSCGVSGRDARVTAPPHGGRDARVTVGHDGLDGFVADAFDGGEAEADGGDAMVVGDDGEVGVGLVDVRGEDVDADLLGKPVALRRRHTGVLWYMDMSAFVDVFDGFGLVDHFEGEEGRHVLGGEVGFEPGGLVGDEGRSGWSGTY